MALGVLVPAPRAPLSRAITPRHLTPYPVASAPPHLPTLPSTNTTRHLSHTQFTLFRYSDEVVIRKEGKRGKVGQRGTACMCGCVCVRWVWGLGAVAVPASPVDPPGMHASPACAALADVLNRPRPLGVSPLQ